MTSGFHIRTRTLVVLFFFAVAVRLVVGIAFGLNKPMVVDELEFFEPASRIVEGHGLAMVPQQSHDGIARPTAFRMPAPAMILAAMIGLFGKQIWVARITCHLVASLSAPLIYCYTRRFASDRAALLAAILCAVHPTWAYYSNEVLSEPFFVPAMLLALVVSADSMIFDDRSDRRSFAAGLAWGLATLVRPHGIVLGFAVIVCLGWRKGWRSMAIASVGVACLMAPWFVRNLVVFHRPVLLATEAGETFLGSNNPLVLENPKLRGMWIAPMGVIAYRDHLDPVQDEFERNGEQLRMGLDFLKGNPGAIPFLVVYKLQRWLTPVTTSGGMIRTMVLFSYGGLLLLLAAGWATRTYTQSIPLLLNGACTAGLALITVVFWGCLTRGRLPLEILWIPWGAPPDRPGD